MRTFRVKFIHRVVPGRCVLNLPGAAPGSWSWPEGTYVTKTVASLVTKMPCARARARIVIQRPARSDQEQVGLYETKTERKQVFIIV